MSEDEKATAVARVVGTSLALAMLREQVEEALDERARHVAACAALGMGPKEIMNAVAQDAARRQLRGVSLGYETIRGDIRRLPRRG